MRVRRIPGARGDLPHFGGRIVTRQTRWGTVTQAWPRKRTKRYSAAEVERLAEFTIAAHWTENHWIIDRLTAHEWSKKTLYTWRDVLTMGYFGNYIRIRGEDGQLWQRERAVIPSAQAIYEQLGDVPGSIIYRDDLLWENLPPGPEEAVLALLNGKPAWSLNAGSGGVLTPQYLLLEDDDRLPNARALDLGVGLVLDLSVARQATLSANINTLLDALGDAARGTLLFRGADGWQLLDAAETGKFLRASGAGADPQWSVLSGEGANQITIFDVPGDYTGSSGWQKPPGCVWADVYLIGGGGGGGSGRRGPLASVCGGGGGGGGAGYTWVRMRADLLPNQVSVRVGAGGAGGAARLVNAQNGAAGGAGGVSYFGSLNPADGLVPVMLRANGGGAGTLGTTGGSGNSSGGTGRNNGAGGTGGGGAGTASSPGAPPVPPAPCGGGGGAGVNTNAVTSDDGGAGGSYVGTTPWSGSGGTEMRAGAGIGATKTNPQNGTQSAYEPGIGFGGGGGWHHSDGTAASGANGAQAGGGGGGGGSSRDGNNSGAGGSGGHGICVIVAY